MRDVDLSDTDLDTDSDKDIPSKHFVCLQDVFKTCLQDVFARRLGRRKTVTLKTF